MSSPPLPSALDARTQAFPVLPKAQIDRIRASGRVRNVERGEILFEPNDAAIPFFVLLSGRMEIVQPNFDGERQIATHGPGEFTGEIAMISGQRSLVRGRVTEPGQFIEVDGDAFRSLIAKDAELSETLLRAFILRRLELISHGYGNVILLGSRHSAQDFGATRISDPERLSSHLHRSGHRPQLAGFVGPLRRKSIRSSGGDLQRQQQSAAKSEYSRTGELPGL